MKTELVFLGDIRYWPSIAHDGLSIDETGILDGQEFDELMSIPSVGYILVTTTCNLVLLQLQLNNSRHNIIHRTVRPPTGFLGGISKKFASILIGSSSQDRENVSRNAEIIVKYYFLMIVVITSDSYERVSNGQNHRIGTFLCCLTNLFSVGRSK